MRVGELWSALIHCIPRRQQSRSFASYSVVSWHDYPVITYLYLYTLSARRQPENLGIDSDIHAATEVLFSSLRAAPQGLGAGTLEINVHISSKMPSPKVSRHSTIHTLENSAAWRLYGKFRRNPVRDLPLLPNKFYYWSRPCIRISLLISTLAPTPFISQNASRASRSFLIHISAENHYEAASPSASICTISCECWPRHTSRETKKDGQ